jgi:hypothetical protein
MFDTEFNWYINFGTYLYQMLSFVTVTIIKLM